MTTSLLNVGATNVGTTPVVAYTVPAGQTAMLLGCTLTNVFGTIVPVTVLVRKATLDVRLAYNRRIQPGRSEEIVVGKVVLASGDSVVLSGAADNAFDALLSIAQGV